MNPVQQSNKRQVTSAIEGMTVAEVRRGLDTLRSKWTESIENAENVFFMCDTIYNGMTFEELAFQFVKGHHCKRHKKAKSAQTHEAATSPVVTRTRSARLKRNLEEFD
ncbi:MAG: hypothetical protein K0U52_04570 [Gammaproteobacteria bacterium]|nr:hypothetical protein [Gammaproteobacteria bacterium]